MSLSYVNSCSLVHSNQRRALDDNYIRSPVILAPEQVNPLTTSLDSRYTSRTWRLATVGKDQLVEGYRLENALWRVWAQQRLGLQRIEGADIDWEQLTAWKYKSLLGPVVISRDTCMHTIELAVASTPHQFSKDLQPISASRPSLESNELTVPPRPCLRRRSTSPSESSLRNHSLSISPSRHHRVLFNKCVVQCIIKEDEYSSDPEDLSEYDLPTPGLQSTFDTDMTGPKFSSLFVEHFDPPHLYECETALSRCPTIVSFDPVSSIEHLPPMELHLTDMEKAENVIFVPPPGMEYLAEDELLPCEKVSTPPRRNKSSRELSLAEEEDIAMEASLGDLSIGRMNRSNSTLSLDGGSRSLEPRGRRRRSKRLFVMEEDEDVDEEGKAVAEAEERNVGEHFSRRNLRYEREAWFSQHLRRGGYSRSRRNGQWIDGSSRGSRRSNHRTTETTGQ